MATTTSRYNVPPGIDLKASERSRIIGSCVALWVITDLIVFMRLLSRKLARAGYWWDDVLAVVAMIFSNVLCIIWFTELRHGYGRHIYIWPAAQRMHQEIQWRKGFFVVELFFHTAITICKLSVLAFYFRIFPYRKFRTILWVVAALAIAYGVAVDISIFFQCQPLHYIWDLPDPKVQGSCVALHKFFVGKGIANVVLNVIIFLLPIPLLWRLRVTLRQQVVLTSVFTLAGFVIIVSIIWIIVVPPVASPDITWDSVDFGIWSTVEPHVAVMCACLPSLRPLFTILRRSAFQHPLIQTKLNNLSSLNHHRSNNNKNGTNLTNLSSLSHNIKHKLPFSSRTGQGKLNDSLSSSADEQHIGSGYDGRFSRLEEMDDLSALPGAYGTGHGVKVTAGNAAGAGGNGVDMEKGRAGSPAMKIPDMRIGVKTEVVVESERRLDYNDRLY